MKQHLYENMWSQYTIMENKNETSTTVTLLRKVRQVSFWIFRKIDRIFVIAEIVKDFVVRFRFGHRSWNESYKY